MPKTATAWKLDDTEAKTPDYGESPDKESIPKSDEQKTIIKKDNGSNAG